MKLFNYFWLKFVKVDIENPIALRFIMQDDLFFLKEDREAFSGVREPAKPAAAAEETVVAETNVAEPVLETVAIEFNYKGKKGEMLVLVHYPELEFIHDAHLAALENILKRKGLAVDDVAILNMAKHGDTDFETLASYFAAPKILLLGEKSLPAGIIPLKLNMPQVVNNTAMLYSFSFDEMMDSPDNKKAFWEQMKGF